MDFSHLINQKKRKGIKKEEKWSLTAMTTVVYSNDGGASRHFGGDSIGVQCGGAIMLRGGRFGHF